MPSLRRILGIKLPNTQVLINAGFTTIYTAFQQTWLDHMNHMEDGRITKNILYIELAFAKSVGGHQLRQKETCKCSMKSLDINTKV